MDTRHRKLIVDDVLLRVFLVGSDCEKEVESLKFLKGVIIEDATPEEFLNDYRKRYGNPVDIK